MVLTIIRIEPSADSGPFFINLAAVVTLKVSAAVLHIEVPLPVLDKNRCFLMTDIPADILKIVPGGGLVNLQRQVFAAKGIAFCTGVAHYSSPNKYTI